MDFLQFINHIQKKITGSNRVHGIGQGHSGNTVPFADGAAPLGYFNADMVDGLHARTTNVNLDSAYIPVANSQENPNLAAQLLLATLKRPDVQNDATAVHRLEMNDYDAGLQRFENADLKWRINSYALNDRLWVSDNGSENWKIEPPNNNAVFFGNSIGIRGWTAQNTGALYLGAGADGGFWSWSYTGTYDDQPDAKLIIRTDGAIEGSSIANSSIPVSKLNGTINAATATTAEYLNLKTGDSVNSGSTGGSSTVSGRKLGCVVKRVADIGSSATLNISPPSNGQWVGAGAYSDEFPGAIGDKQVMPGWSFGGNSIRFDSEVSSGGYLMLWYTIPD